MINYSSSQEYYRVDVLGGKNGSGFRQIPGGYASQ